MIEKRRDGIEVRFIVEVNCLYWIGKGFFIRLLVIIIEIVKKYWI